MAHFDKKINRLRVEVCNDGLRMHDYRHGVTLSLLDGFNEDCPIASHNLSIDELRDLRYLTDRAIALAEQNHWKK